MNGDASVRPCDGNCGLPEKNSEPRGTPDTLSHPPRRLWLYAPGLSALAGREDGGRGAQMLLVCTPSA